MNKLFILYDIANSFTKEFPDCDSCQIRAFKDFSVFNKYQILLVEINDSLADDANLPLKYMKEHNALIFYSFNITEIQKKFLKQNGFSRLLHYKEILYNPEIINIIREEDFDDSVFILDANKSTVSIVKSILGCYSISLKELSGHDELFEHFQKPHKFILLNLEDPSFDINVFVKKMITLKAKKPILIPYKAAIQDVTINEIKSGINRYINAILSVDEVYNFLVNYFSIIETNYRLNVLVKAFNSDCCKTVSGSSFENLYHSLRSNIFCIKNDNIRNIRNLIEESSMFHNSLGKILPYRWLITDNKKETIFERGVCK